MTATEVQKIIDSHLKVTGLDLESMPIRNIIEIEGLQEYAFEIKTTRNTNLCLQ
jgi:hypothetical protein